jgi:hypothetical protein
MLRSPRRAVLPSLQGRRTLHPSPSRHCREQSASIEEETSMANRAVLTSIHGREIGLAGDRTLVVRAEPDNVTFSVAPGTAGSNISIVTLQVVNNEGASISAALPLVLWLSDSAIGAGLTLITASGPVTVGSTGADFGDLTPKKAKVVQTDATGKYVLSITDTAKSPFFVCALVPRRGSTAISTQLVSANYG